MEAEEGTGLRGGEPGRGAEEHRRGAQARALQADQPVSRSEIARGWPLGRICWHLCFDLHN